MSEKVKIYHVETQEDYDDLMIKLEEQGCRWANHDKPTSNPHYWFDMEDETVVYLHKSGDFLMTRGNLKTAISNHRMKEIIKHKAKGVEQMKKVVVPQFVADWYEDNKHRNLYALLLASDSTYGVNSHSWAKQLDGQQDSALYNAHDVLAKVHLYGYEVEEEKKYYWRKKKEHLLEFEDKEKTYLTISYNGRVLFSDNCLSPDYHTKLTETEARQVVSEEDFNKLEKVEITE